MWKSKRLILYFMLIQQSQQKIAGTGIEIAGLVIAGVVFLVNTSLIGKKSLDQMSKEEHDKMANLKKELTNASIQMKDTEKSIEELRNKILFVDNKIKKNLERIKKLKEENETKEQFIKSATNTNQSNVISTITTEEVREAKNERKENAIKIEEIEEENEILKQSQSETNQVITTKTNDLKDKHVLLTYNAAIASMFEKYHLQLPNIKTYQEWVTQTNKIITKDLSLINSKIVSCGYKYTKSMLRILKEKWLQKKILEKSSWYSSNEFEGKEDYNEAKLIEAMEFLQQNPNRADTEAQSHLVYFAHHSIQYVKQNKNTSAITDIIYKMVKLFHTNHYLRLSHMDKIGTLNELSKEYINISKDMQYIYILMIIYVISMQINNKIQIEGEKGKVVFDTNKQFDEHDLKTYLVLAEYNNIIPVEIFHTVRKFSQMTQNILGSIQGIEENTSVIEQVGRKILEGQSISNEELNNILSEISKEIIDKKETNITQELESLAPVINGVNSLVESTNSFVIHKV